MENENTPTPELYTAPPGDMPVPELVNETPVPELYMDDMDMEAMEDYMEMQGMPMDDFYATTPPTGGEMALVAGMTGLWFLFIFGMMAVMIVAFWKIFTKAGEDGWKSLIPFYNTWVLLEISGKPGWWLFLMFIPFVNIIIMVMMYNGLSKSFGKGIGYTLGLIFLSPIFFLMLAFGNATHVSAKNTQENANIPPKNPELTAPPKATPIQETPDQTI